MKKILFLLLVLVIVGTTHAQFGVKGGANFSTLRGSDVSDAKTKVGFYFGPFYNIGISDNISVQTEAVYSAEGAKEDGSDGVIKLNFINISALFRYNSGGFFVGTGPQYGFLASAKAEFSGTSTDVKDQLKSGNFAWALAVGYDLPSGLGFYARYALGLGTIAKEDMGSTDDVKTGCIQAGLRYTFNKGGKGKD